jgi:hypothetical protein
LGRRGDAATALAETEWAIGADSNPGNPAVFGSTKSNASGVCCSENCANGEAGIAEIATEDSR